MASVPQCDRCQKVPIQVVPVLGKDLCAGCREAFVEWVDLGSIQSAAARPARPGERWEQVLSILKSRGYVTSQLMADHFGFNRHQAINYLHEQRRVGKLELIGRAKFALPRSQEAAE